MATLTGSLTSNSTSAAFTVKHGDKFTYSVSNTYSGVLKLIYTEDGGSSYKVLRTFTNGQTVSDVEVKVELPSEGAAAYAFEMTGYVSGQADFSFADVVIVLQEFKNQDGSPVLQILENGIKVFGNVFNEGAIVGTGIPAGTGVTAVESAVDGYRRTILTLVDTPISIVSVSTGNGVGGTKIYDFPAGYIKKLGCLASLSVRVATANQGDFTDNTPEGDLGIGTVAPANADALGTDATDDNFATATAFSMTAFEDTSVLLPPENTGNFDGTVTPVDLYLNALVDAADIDDDVTTEILVSGTVTLTWLNLGDFA